MNERLMEVYRELKKTGLITTKTAFMESIGQSKQHFAGFEEGTRKVHPKHITLLGNQFGVSSDYMLTGTGPVFKENPATGVNYSNVGKGNVNAAGNVSYGTNQDCEQKLAAAYKEIEHLKERLQDKERLIELLMKR